MPIRKIQTMSFEKLGNENITQAIAVAEEFATRFKRDGVVGVVFLGAIGRGYFDEFSDIDVIIFKMKNVELGLRSEDEVECEGFKIDYEITNYEDSLASEWDMDKRWASSNARIFYDPEDKMRLMIDEKTPLQIEDKRWMIIEGMTQSEWCCNDLSESWVHRGDIISSHYSVNNGLDELLKVLFALNGRLLPPKKWRVYLSQDLKWLPNGFTDNLKQIMLIGAISLEELQRRREALNYLWRQMLPRAEKEVGMKFNEFKRLV